MKLSEEELQEQLTKLNKRKNAFSEVVRVFQERLYWHIRKMLLSHEDSNDVLQNTFLKAWNGLDNFRGDSQLSTWLYRIATNETLTFLANKRLRNLQSIDDVEDMLLQTLKSDNYFNGDEAHMKLQKAILTLPEKQRLVFNMKYFDEMKYEDMEAILGTTTGALKASYHHAVKKIEKYLEEAE
ncbi:sigma-70 family RNA polymerase sigma factor [Paludibacter sp. 221]|uniref:RNA polymerase sigma factor n=1 Tax=Paludibacter sp. 221 TaxID=2302939 RepID=UPI0013D34553|nr:sigma-70 family RNA polymerase sigma factor [Paludibacter sp. 221]NDV46176.1 sigma-70 family RNA polymerase sigma factor [Paludibacter sp. 221]